MAAVFDSAVFMGTAFSASFETFAGAALTVFAAEDFTAVLVDFAATVFVLVLVSFTADFFSAVFFVDFDAAFLSEAAAVFFSLIPPIESIIKFLGHFV